MLEFGDCETSGIYDLHLGMSPVRIEFELTEACNLECRFCYNSREPKFVSKADAVGILETLSAQGVIEIVLTGGEPLLHPDFRAIAEKAVRLFSNVFVQTNGVLLTEDLAKYLKSIGIAGINISLHGGVKEHEALTQRKGSHYSATQGICNALASSPATWVNTVLTSVNRSCLAAHLNSLLELGVRNFTFTRFTPTGVGKAEAELGLLPSELVEVLQILDQFLKANTNCTGLVANALPKCLLPKDLSHYAEPCSYGMSRFYVDVQGFLLVCGMSRVRLGNVLTNSIHNIKLHSQEVRQLCTGEAYPSTCRSCVLVEECRGGCRAAALTATGRFDGVDPLAQDSFTLHSEKL